MINLEWLRTFNSIFECATLTEASKKLNMTQPGVSKHLAALEQHIGKKLFERSTRKLLPTEYGKFLYTQINTPLRELEKIEYYAGKKAKKEKAAIIIGCTTDYYNQNLIQYIYNFDMYIVVQFGTEKELIEALENDTIQLLIGIKKHAHYEHQFSFIAEQELVLVCSKSIDFPQDIEEDKLMKWLLKQNWFAPNNTLSDLKEYWEINFNSTPKLIPQYILPSYANIVKALQYTMGFSIIPKHLCQTELENNLIQMPIIATKPMLQKLYYSYQTKNSNAKEITTFINKMRAVKS